MKNYRILAINPGSTSTKVAAYDGQHELFKETITHSAEVLAQFHNVEDQLDYRRETIEAVLRSHKLTAEDFDAFAGRGGGLVACEGGVFQVNQIMLEHAASGQYGGNHPARLGCLLANGLASRVGKPAFVVNGPDTDEFCEEARITGLSDIYRASHVHALNHKETALRVAGELGLRYEDASFIVAHLGGGVSIAAHRKGRMIDSNDTINGDGPMAPTRAGGLPAKEFLDLCFSGRWSHEELYRRLTKTGGLVDHLGTSELREVTARIAEGDRYAQLVYNAFIYQIAKQIGAMAAVLEGQVDAIILTGGIAHDQVLVSRLEQKIGFLGPIIVKAGEAEMEALSAGGLRVLSGQEVAKEYTGIPVFQNFNSIKEMR